MPSIYPNLDQELINMWQALSLLTPLQALFLVYIRSFVD